MSIQDSGMWLLFPEVYSSLVSGPGFSIWSCGDVTAEAHFVPLSQPGEGGS